MEIEWKDMNSCCGAYEGGHLIKLNDGHGFIAYNGSKWAGQAPDQLAELFRTLQKYTVNSMFQVELGVMWVASTQQPPRGSWVISGNFEEYSHAFCIYGDSDRLYRAIMKRVKS
jgi:hypothetical protein